MTSLLAVSGEGYVAAAGVVFLAILVIYLAIMAAKIQRIEREVTTLSDLADRRER